MSSTRSAAPPPFVDPRFLRHAQPAPDPERLMRTCPVCSHELEERKCKLFCPRPGCGYFLSCADFY